jgi:Zn-dependent peptidase ImmA (M78 family)
MHAARIADQTIAQLGLTALPIDPKEIAEKSGIVVRELPPHFSEFSGALSRVGNKFGILYATNIESPGRQRFNIAHELGHYFTPGHVEKLLVHGMHQSKGEFRSADEHEREADDFASRLLMPTQLCQKLVDGESGVGLEVVEHLAKTAQVSLTAASLRYTDLTSHAVAIVVSSRAAIEYCFLSDELRDQLGDVRLPAGSPVAGMKKMTTPTAIMHADRSDVYEQTVNLGSYGKVLTILTADADHE